MEDDLLCNFRKCRKRLGPFAWVTSCSHIFCDEHGTREFNKGYACPACDTRLSGKYDVVRTDMQPSEVYKSMVLAGLRPDVIMEISTRALSFWTYQTHQERTYQEYVASKTKEKNTQLEQYCQQVMTKTEAEIKSLKAQIAVKSKELEESKLKNNEMSEKLMGRNRQYLKLQGMYDSLRRRSVTPAIHEDQRDLPTAARNSFMIPLGVGGDRLRHSSSLVDLNLLSRPTNLLPAERPGEFVLQPTQLDANDVIDQNVTSGERENEQVQQRFTLDLGTPGITRRLGQRKER